MSFGEKEGKMKRVCFYLALLLVLSLAIPAYAGGGNGAPSGAHYNLNIIGVPKDKTAAMDENNGHRIFVKLEGKSKIMLGEGDEFRVIDANGTDHDGATFQLPCPDIENDGVTEYSVWARALGKPGEGEDVKAIMSTCAYDDPEEEGMEPELVCTMYSLTMVRTKGRSKFKDVSKELLYIYADLVEDDFNTPERYPLFDDALEGYFWDYDNHGLKLAQFRFYEMSTQEPDPGPFELP
jgi:hypothetical protein